MSKFCLVNHRITVCVLKGFFRLCFSREATASHFFMAYMGVRTCSHKTIYDIKKLPKARKAQADCGGRFLSKPCLTFRLSDTASAVRHVRYANIVQRVKICYKIKIDYRVPVCCFYGVLLCKQHPRHTIAPLLQSNSATIRV